MHERCNTLMVKVIHLKHPIYVLGLKSLRPCLHVLIFISFPRCLFFYFFHLSFNFILLFLCWKLLNKSEWRVPSLKSIALFPRWPTSSCTTNHFSSTWTTNQCWSTIFWPYSHQEWTTQEQLHSSENNPDFHSSNHTFALFKIITTRSAAQSYLRFTT